MDPTFYLALGATVGLWFWRTRTSRRGAPAPGDQRDESLQVVMHVAQCDADRRGHDQHPLHLLYGLLQDDAIEKGLLCAGVDPEALTNRVLDALDALHVPKSRRRYTEAARRVTTVGYTPAHATRRQMTTADLWHGLMSEPELRALVGENGCDVLFSLVHSRSRGDVVGDYGDAREATVTLVNDDYTSMEFVTELLSTVFALEDAEASRKMLQTHHEGCAVVFSGSGVASGEKVRQATERARALWLPLYVGPLLSRENDASQMN